MESQLVVAEGREGVGQEGSGRGKEETARVPLGGDVTAVLQNVTAAGGAERRPPGLAPGAGRSGGGPHSPGGAVGPAACWRPSRRPGVFRSWCRPGSLWAHGCQRHALHHRSASTRLGSRAPRPAEDGMWSPNPLHWFSASDFS